MGSTIEKLIGARLRAFRELLQIPRSKYAVTIGFGSERVASYEAARSPLPYDVFLAVAKHYSLNPVWLATGKYTIRLPGVSGLLTTIQHKPRQLFSEVFTQNIKIFFAIQNKLWERSNLAMEDALTQLEHDMQTLDSNSDMDKAAVLEQLALVDKIIDENKSQFALTQQAKAILPEILLQDVNELVKLSPVKPLLPAFLERLKKATSQRGKKTELADFLDVPLASISQWLSGDREPGGETTLKMQHWVQHQERQK